MISCCSFLNRIWLGYSVNFIISTQQLRWSHATSKLQLTCNMLQYGERSVLLSFAPSYTVISHVITCLISLFLYFLATFFLVHCFYFPYFFYLACIIEPPLPVLCPFLFFSSYNLSDNRFCCSNG